MHSVPIGGWVIFGIVIALIVVSWIKSIRDHNKLMDLYDKAFRADLAFMDAWMRTPPRMPAPSRPVVSLKKTDNTSP